ncbi:MAG: hypothetical protein K8U57_35620, partial [Planctomycetes bacterium]|nr:hypothetical protein [Planctomycetota bacterium]
KRRQKWRKEGSSGGASGSVQYIYRHDHREFGGLLATALTDVRVTGAGFPLPYRFKLSPLSRRLERFFQNRTWMADSGHMLVGVGEAAKVS